MADFTAFATQLARIQTEVQEAIALLEAGKTDQATIDAATEALKAASDALDVFTPGVPIPTA